MRTHSVMEPVMEPDAIDGAQRQRKIVKRLKWLVLLVYILSSVAALMWVSYMAGCATTERSSELDVERITLARDGWVLDVTIKAGRVEDVGVSGPEGVAFPVPGFADRFDEGAREGWIVQAE